MTWLNFSPIMFPAARVLFKRYLLSCQGNLRSYRVCSICLLSCQTWYLYQHSYYVNIACIRDVKMATNVYQHSFLWTNCLRCQNKKKGLKTPLYKLRILFFFCFLSQWRCWQTQNPHNLWSWQPRCTWEDGW